MVFFYFLRGERGSRRRPALPVALAFGRESVQEAECMLGTWTPGEQLPAEQPGGRGSPIIRKRISEHLLQTGLPVCYLKRETMLL